MLKKFIAMASAAVFFAACFTVTGSTMASAAAPSLTWSTSPITTTTNLTLSAALISEDGTTKVNVTTGGSSVSIYSSRNGGNWVLATGTSQMGYLVGSGLSQTGQYVVLVGMPFGQGVPVVLVSNDYGVTFTANAPFTGSSSRYSARVGISPDGRTVVISSFYYSGVNSQTSNAEIVTSNNYGATWSYKSLGQGSWPNVFATSASYLGAGKNAIFVSYSGNSFLQSHIFASSDTGEISGSLADVDGTNSSDDNRLAEVIGVAISSDGTKALVTTQSTVSSIYNVVIETTGTWTFGSVVTPTFSPSSPTSLTGSLEKISLSADGQTVGFYWTVFSNNSSQLHGFISQDSGATFTAVISAATYYSGPQFSITSSTPAKVYTVKNGTAFNSTDGGQNFANDVMSVTAPAKVTSITGSADGSLLALTVSAISGPPSIYLSRDSGATATVIDGTGGASSTYNASAYVASDGSKIVLNVINYSTNPSTNTLKEFYGSNFGSSRSLNLPTGVTSIASVAFNRDLSAILLAGRTSGANGYLYYGTISNGVVTWSSGLGDLTSYTGLAITSLGIHAISTAQTKLYQAPITNGVLGSLTTNTSPFANGFTGTWSSMSASADGTKLVVANYGLISNNCYAGGYVYKSSDSGATWNVIPGNANSRQVGAPSISPDGSAIAYGVANGGYMNLSLDGGATFDNLSDLGTLTCAGTISGVRSWSAPFLYSPNGTNLGIAASSSTQVLRVTSYSASAPSLTSQTISFTNPSTMTVGDADQTLTVSASSALSVALTTGDSSICTIVSGKARAVGAGTCSITASQSGNNTYSAATSVTKTFTISASSSSAPSLTPEQIAAQQAAQAAAEAAAAEAARQEAIAKAKVALHELLANGKPGSLEMFNNADYNVANEKTAQRVNDSLLKLPIVDRTNVEKIKYVVKFENFINQVSNKTSQKSITTNQLVEFGIVTASTSNKVSILSAIKKADPLTLTSLEKIQEVVKTELAVIKARADRAAAIKAKIAARKK